MINYLIDNNQMDNNVTKISRKQKLEVIGLDESYTTKKLSNKLLNEIYDDILKNKKEIDLNKGQHVSKPKTDKVDGTDERYILTLLLSPINFRLDIQCHK
jgi:hypothetical protein